MIVLNDTSKIKPPYQLTPEILKLITAINLKIGEVNASHILNASPFLRKQNQIKTIHSSLKIQGNTRCEQQITALLDDKRIAKPEKDITEVFNAIKVYKPVLC